MFFPFRDTAEAMSHTSPRSYELSHCVIARDGTWIDIRAILAEEETRSEAAASFQKPDRSGFFLSSVQRRAKLRCLSHRVVSTDRHLSCACRGRDKNGAIATSISAFETPSSYYGASYILSYCLANWQSSSVSPLASHENSLIRINL
ncbi:hypothetical protein SAMN05421736_101232 [Evansella caseinilytica]|uniref:Uncharacterized protein n=1 Tax=Evansella caseinilytica TaxID=1503961 RepID=A0A1H3GNQ4_9BACI|nr:hypothetical protein SAMN05421736_101232 [Evansella caseinilytica]